MEWKRPKIENFEAVVEDGVYYGRLTVGDQQFLEPLPEAIGHMPEDKQRYWMRRCIDKLQSRAKLAKAMAIHKERKKGIIGKRIMQEQALHDQLTALGVERRDEGSEAQNGGAVGT